MRSFNEGWALRDTLPAVQAQEYGDWELIVIDSGSTDGSQEIIRTANPRHFIQIQPHEYNPSRVMNQGMQLARGEFAIFLNADATPQRPDWLRPLVNALQDPQTAAVFGRQIPRPNCRAVYSHDYDRCFGENRESATWEHFFSMVSSGLRKDVWKKRGFLEKMQYSEDDEYTRWCRAQGYRIVYCPESVVMHSHNYTPREAYKRSFGEARALSAVWQHSPEEFNWPRTIALGWLNDLRRDFLFCRRHHRVTELPHAALIRWNQRRAKLAGFRAGWQHYRTSGSAVGAQDSASAKQRFTLDGDDKLENRLGQLCLEISTAIQKIIPPAKMKSIVLGGGYGRGQGGVLRTENGDQPYNDLEFYLFLRGNPLLQERSHRAALHELGERLSRREGLHIEFKIDSLERLRSAPVSMFSYDLVSARRIVMGTAEIFAGCEHHRDAKKIPASEATRLLFNRSSGLLLVRELLGRKELLAEDIDFIIRNLAKAKLAFGDALLTIVGQYHWDCMERHSRLAKMVQSKLSNSLADNSRPTHFSFQEIVVLHGQGVEFKLHPNRGLQEKAALEIEFRRISKLAAQLWLWLESLRLNRAFNSVQEYALSDLTKCNEQPAWRNYLINFKTFGPRALMHWEGLRYPRERLFNSLPLLLWNGEVSREPEIAHRLQRQLLTRAKDWQGFVSAYKEIWPTFS